jgi:Uma2 family endonuclease
MGFILKKAYICKNIFLMTDTLIRLKNRLSDDEFFELCRMNDLRMERLKDGTIIMMEPTGSETGNFNFEVSGEIRDWNKSTKEGKAFDSSAGFTLPDTSVKSPDTSWVKKDRWQQLSDELKEKFAPIAPDFVLEIRSKSDNLKDLQEKMLEYIKNGVRLAWLMDRKNEITYIYRLDGSISTCSFKETLSGEDVLVGFQLCIANLETD